MRGYQQYNFPAFFEAEGALKAAGWEVLNPARMDREQDGFDETSGENIAPIDHYIRRDFEAIMSLDPERDMLALLPGWGRSVGARAEHALAVWRNLRLAFL